MTSLTDDFCLAFTYLLFQILGLGLAKPNNLDTTGQEGPDS